MERTLEQRVSLQVRVYEARQRTLGGLAIDHVPEQATVSSVNAAEAAEQTQAVSVEA